MNKLYKIAVTLNANGNTYTAISSNVRTVIPVSATGYLTGKPGPNTVAGLLTAGNNIVLTGSGTASSPYSIASTAVGGIAGITSAQSKTTAFTAVANVKYLVDATTAAVTVTLPTTNTLTQQIVIQKSDAGTNLVTISGTINGVTSSTSSLRSQNQGKLLQGDGTGNWNIIAGDVSVSALDTRYQPNVVAGTTQTASFSALPNIFYQVSATTAAVTATLPATNTIAQQIEIKKTDSSTNIVTISGKINGVAASSLPLRLQDQGKVLVGDGTGNWNVYAGDISLATLDARYTAAGASGTVTSVSVVTANGVSGTVATATTTPAITLTLGAITPTSVAATGAVTGSNLSGTNTGDQTSVSGNAGTATKLATARTIATNLATTTAASFDGTANVTPGVSGTLPYSNGGTSATTQQGLINNSNPHTTLGDLDTSNGTNVVRLAATTSTTRQFLMSQGTGSAPQALSYTTLIAADVPTLNQNTTGQAGTVATINGLITAGSNITISGSGTSASPYSITSTAAGGSSGITRNITTGSTNVTLGSTALTDYVYVCTGSSAYTVTLPSPTSNTNLYTIANYSTVTQSIATTSGTINGTTAPISIPPNVSYDIITTGTNWYII